MAASSSSCSAAAAKKYDVFISFRGEDTRHSFTSHLYHALRRYSIRTYIDRELNKGDNISPSLIQAIQDSHGSLVIFSKNYASSKWCLNELLKILECRRQGHFVIPVFYNIDPSEVRKQNASFGKAFAKHKQDPKNNAVLKNWKAALTEAANIAGWDSRSRNDRDEAELILNIVEDVSQKLDHIYQLRKLGLVGIDKRCERIEALLQEFPVVGIWGMGGIGKTTLARAIFDKLYSKYDSCCFLENIREESQRRGLKQLRLELFRRLLKGEINLHKAEASKHAIRRLSTMKILIVLDDLTSFEQLEYLGQGHGSLKFGSRVIITTRDKHLLTSLRAKHGIYEVERLDDKESLELFRLEAFNEHFPENGYEEIIKKIVSYAQGAPIALKILGLFLHSKTIKEWESTWKRLKKFPHKDIEKVLRLSFDGLNHVDQQIFLDIACFFKGEDKEEVVSMLDSFGFDSAIGLRTLQDKALITVSYDNTIQMHELIQDMGRQIVREESIQEPGRRSRLWNPEEVYDVLKYNKGTHKVEGIILDMSQIKDLHLSDDTFKKMMNLRYLNFYTPCFLKSGKMHAAVTTRLFSEKLRYLHWAEFPLQSLSSSFCAENLVELNMPFSNMRKLWNGVQDLPNLESLNLSGSKELIELPDFSKATKLKLVELCDCTNLCHIHPSVLSSHTLETLDVSWCKKLRSLRSEIHLKSLKNLCFLECPSLKEFSLSSEKLGNLSIWGTAVETLHPSIGLCENLEGLFVHGSLEKIPSDLSKLTSLKSLTIIGCTELDTRNLHIILRSLLSLREVNLMDFLNLSELPNDIKYLSYLTSLKIQNCGRLLYIPELPASIEEVQLINCKSLETIIPPKSVKYKQSCYLLANCVELDEHSLSSIIEHACSCIKQVAAEASCENASTNEDFSDNYIIFPGNRVPSWFGCQTAQNWIGIEIPPHSHLLGFAFYCILSLEVLLYEGESLQGCGCNCYLENGESMISNGNEFYFSLPDEFFIDELISDHVCIWYDRWDCSDLFDEMEKQKAQGQRTKRLYFEFYVEAGEEKGDEIESFIIENAIKGCGVLPMYASKYDNSINDLELRLGVKLGYKTHDIDEHVELQFDELGPSTSATRFTSSGFDLRGQGISLQNARQDLPQINSLCLFNRFNKLNCSTSQMELKLEFGFGDKSKMFQDIDDHQLLQRKKFERCQDIGELLGGASTSGIGVGCSEFALQLAQANTMNEFVFQPPPTGLSMQNALVDFAKMNSTDLLDWFSEFDNNIMQFIQTGFCPCLNEMPIGDNSLDADQQNPNLSLRLNQGHPQINPFDIGANSGPYTSLNSFGLPEVVQMEQANNAFGTFAFCLNQEDPQMNLLKGIEVGGSHQENQHEQEQLVTGNEISCGCFIGLLLKPLWKLFSTA